MTITTIANQIHDMAIAGYINGEKFTKKELSSCLRTWLKTKDQHIIEVSLPDGRWLCKVYRYAKNEYDYFLPDTREQERRLYAELGITE